MLLLRLRLLLRLMRYDGDWYSGSRRANGGSRPSISSADDGGNLLLLLIRKMLLMML